jgi:hypothetical protein
MSIIPSLAAPCGESLSGRDQLKSARISGKGRVRVSGTCKDLVEKVESEPWIQCAASCEPLP